MKTRHDTYRKSWVSYAAALAMVGVVWLAYDNFRVQRLYSNVAYIGGRLEANVPVSAQAVHDYRGLAMAMAEVGECRSELLGAGLSLLLADLDAAGSPNSTDERAASLRSVERFLTHMLSCTPTDGDAWARLAMVRQALGEKPSEEAALLERSSWFAPSEGSTLAARLEVWRRATDATLALAEPALDRDILAALSYYSTRDAARTLSGGGKRFQERVKAASASLSNQRVTDLRLAGLDIIPSRATQPLLPLPK